MCVEWASCVKKKRRAVKVTSAVPVRLHFNEQDGGKYSQIHLNLCDVSSILLVFLEIILSVFLG